MPTGFYIWLVVFIIIVIGTITKPLWLGENNNASNKEILSDFYLKSINSLIYKIKTATTKEEALILFKELQDKCVQYYKLGYHFQGYNRFDRLYYYIDSIFQNRCKELDCKEKQERIYNEIKNKVQITKQYFEQLIKYSNEDINKYTFQENENDLLIWVDNLYLKTLENKLNEVISLINQNNEKGKELEEQGNFKEAAIFYEKNLVIDYSDKLCIDRLLIVYRKLKDYENEKRICELAIQKYSSKKYKDRLLTIEDKITKASKP